MSWDRLYGNTLRTLLDDGFDRLKMALHPIVVYYKESSKLPEKLFCFISDDLEHDTEFGFETQRELVNVTEVDFFSDGYAKLQEYVKFV